MTENKWHEETRKILIKDYEKAGFIVVSSHTKKKTKRSNVPLFRDDICGKSINRANHFSDVDLVILKNGKVIKLVEVQQSVRPKEIIGIIATTLLCNKCQLDEDAKDLNGVELEIVAKKQSTDSRKNTQLRWMISQFNQKSKFVSKVNYKEQG